MNLISADIPSIGANHLAAPLLIERLQYAASVQKPKAHKILS